MSNHKRDRRLPKKAFIEERVIGLWNLSYAATHAQVEQVVADHGFKDATFHWARLKARHISRGWLHCGTCSVMFADKETAENAKAALCGVLFDGKAIKVQTKGKRGPHHASDAVGLDSLRSLRDALPKAPRLRNKKPRAKRRIITRSVARELRMSHTLPLRPQFDPSEHLPSIPEQSE